MSPSSDSFDKTPQVATPRPLQPPPRPGAASPASPAPSQDSTPTLIAPEAVPAESIVAPVAAADADGEAVVAPLESYASFFSPDQLAELEKEEERIARRIAMRNRFTAIFMSVGVHLLLFVLFSVVIMSVPKPMPPQIIATASAGSTTNPDEAIQQEEIYRPTTKQVQPNTSTLPVIAAVGVSSVAMPSLDQPMTEFSAVTQMEFGSSMSFGEGPAVALPVVFSGRCTETERLSRLKVGGGSKRCEDAVQKALVWLSKNQNENGSWGKSFPVSMTGLALLAYLGRCETPDSPQFAEPVVNGALYLLNVASQSDGKLVSPAGKLEYEHAIGTYALCELFTLSRRGSRRIPGLSDLLRKSVGIIIKGQNPDGSWNYNYKPGRSDTSVTGWQMQALFSAHHTDIDFPGRDEAFDKGVAYLKRMQGPKGGFGYSEKPEDKMSLAGVGILALQFGGEGKGPEAQKGLEFILTRKSLNYDSINFYEWYYSTQACFQAEGKTWKTWNDMFLSPLLDGQDKSGCWSPEKSDQTNKQSKGDGDFYRTCLATLMLEVYFRYLPTGEKIKKK